jgi:hypothetical protein
MITRSTQPTGALAARVYGETAGCGKSGSGLWGQHVIRLVPGRAHERHRNGSDIATITRVPHPHDYPRP